MKLSLRVVGLMFEQLGSSLNWNKMLHRIIGLMHDELARYC